MHDKINKCAHARVCFLTTDWLAIIRDMMLIFRERAPLPRHALHSSRTRSQCSNKDRTWKQYPPDWQRGRNVIWARWVWQTLLTVDDQEDPMSYCHSVQRWWFSQMHRSTSQSKWHWFLTCSIGYQWEHSNAWFVRKNSLVRRDEDSAFDCICVCNTKKSPSKQMIKVIHRQSEQLTITVFHPPNRFRGNWLVRNISFSLSFLSLSRLLHQCNELLTDRIYNQLRNTHISRSMSWLHN